MPESDARSVPLPISFGHYLGLTIVVRFCQQSLIVAVGLISVVPYF